MIDPENQSAENGQEKGKKSFSEKWYQKWVELFKSFLGTKDLEAIVKDLSEKIGSSAASRTNEVLEIIKGKEDSKNKNLLNTLVAALIQEDDEAVDRILDTTIKDDKGLFKPLVDQTKARKEKKVDPDKEKEEYDKLQKEIEDRKGESIKIINEKLVSEKKEGLKKKIDRERQRIEEERKKREEEPTEEWFKKSLLSAEVLLNEKVRNRKVNPVEERVNREVIDTAKRIIGSYYESGTISERLTDEEKFFLQLYFYDGDNVSKSVKQRLLVNLINSSGEGTDTKKFLYDLASPRKAAEEALSEERLKKLEQLVDQESGKGAGKDLTDLLRTMGAGVPGDESMASNSLRYLNIEPKLYADLNEEFKAKLGINFEALVKDEKLGIYRVSSELSEKQKQQLTSLIFDRLAAEVRMAVDEGKDLRERQYEPLLRAYNTLTAIVGLDTAQKSEIKQKLNFEVISFMLFNSFQSEESKKMVAEMASHIGAESNIFTGMLRRKETFRITDAFGKEMEVGAFNIYDFAKIAGSKITNTEDRLAFGITKPASEVGRTYATMMYASNKPEEKLRGRGILTKRVIIDQYGLGSYEKMLRDYVNIAEGPVSAESEKEFLDKIGKKYFDYHNGVYVYWGMTNQMADYVGNAHIDNSKLAPPAGIPESLWKNDMKLLYLFHENYHGVKNVDMLLQLRTAFNSMLVKEASELWSWLINLEENPTSKVESIFTGLFGGKRIDVGDKSDPRLKSATLVQQAFLGSMFEDETIHLGEKNHKLHHKTKILEGIPVKTKKGLLVVDTMTRRRDWVTFNEKMREQASGWDESVFKEMDFTFIAEKMKHLPRVSQKLLEGGKDPRLNKQKFFFLIDSMSDEFALFDNLAQKRGDTPMKYNLDYFANASKAGITLAQDITYANAIAFIAEAQKVSGVGKVGELAISILERVREKREAMGLWQTYIIPKIVDGKVVIDAGSYVGDLPGSYPLFELEERTVSFEDIRMHPEGVSIASLGGDPTGVDKEEIHYKYALDRMWQLNILTEEEYKHYVKEFFHEMKGWNSKKNPMSELWAHVSGKKLWEYWAAKFNVPEEILKKWIFEGGSEFFGLWWKYFNGTGAGHH